MAVKKARRWLQSGFNLDQFDITARHSMGDLAMSDNGKIFRYVQFLDAVTYVNGHVCTWAGATAGEYKVTNDRAGGSSIAGHGIAGVLQNTEAVPSTANGMFGWLQVAGECSPSGTYTAGNHVMPHATNDGEAVNGTYAATQVGMNLFGFAKSASVVQLIGLV